MFKKCVGFSMFLFLLLSISSFALEFRTGDIISIPRGTIVNDNIFIAAGEINVNGTIKGDLITFGGNTTILGTVEGNIISGGGRVKVSAAAKNVFIGGGEILVDGIVKNDLLVGGGMVSLGEKAKIGKDVFLGCGSANISGKIFRNLRIGCEELKVSSTTLVKGDMIYSARNVAISDNAKILGRITSYVMPDYRGRAVGFLAGVVLAQRIVNFLALLLLGILVIIFMPNQVKLITSKMTGEFWKSLGWGIFSLIVVPIIVILLFLTLIGIPLGLLLFIVYVLGIYVTGIFVSIVIGKWIFARFGKPDISSIWALTVGFIVLKLLTWIPIIGWIFGLIVFLWAFGALVSTRFITYKQAREKGVI